MPQIKHSSKACTVCIRRMTKYRHGREEVNKYRDNYIDAFHNKGRNSESRTFRTENKKEKHFAIPFLFVCLLIKIRSKKILEL